MKIKLINLDIEDRLGLSGSGWVPPLGLISIATYLKEKKRTELRIYDSTVNNEHELVEEIIEDCDRNTVCGFYVSILNYSKVIDVARKAKEKKATIVLGGPYVSSLEKVIMEKHKFIDAIISGQGEVPFALFLEQIPPDKIPNLSYRRNGEVIVNKKEIFNINEFNLDYSFVNLEKYWAAFKNKKRDEFERPISYYTQKGCDWGKCIFCAISDKKLMRKEPKKIWDEIEILKKTYQIDYIYETSDSFTNESKWLEELTKVKPSSLNISWDILSRADAINKETIKYLKKIGVYRVCIGIETGNHELLKKMNKRHTLKDVINVARLLKSYRIKLLPSFMCGVIGETESSLKDTINLSKIIKEISDADEVLVFPMTPLPNSAAYRMLLAKPEMKEKYINEDSLDIEELQKDWYKHFCKIDISRVRSAIDEIKDVYRI